nr:hypothetical protein [Gemmatimonadota bacterium]
MKRALGLEIGRDFVAVCELTLASDGGLKRHRFARHVFTDPGEPAAEDIADACLRLTLELGIRSRTGVLALARSLTYAKPVHLPPVSLEERLLLLALQPERFFPVSERVLVCDLEPAENGSVPIAHAAEAGRVESLVEALGSRGFRIAAVLPAAAALLRAATKAAPDLAAVNWVLVRAEGGDLTAHAYQSRALRVSRRVTDFARDPAAACRELSRTANQSFDGAPLQEVRWSGWRDLAPEWREAATAALPVPVRELSGLPVDGEGLAAYGAALADLEETPRPDLMPATVRARRRRQTRWVTAA